MANFSWLIDGTIIFLYLAGTLFAAIWVKRYVRRLDQFLIAGRNVNLHLGIASLAATEFGIAACMANAELGFKYGFAGITPGIALALAMFIIGSTGFCIQRLREQRVVTLPELFEKKFGSKVRQASGVVIVTGGLLNMGVFLRQAGEFLSIVCGFDLAYLKVIMTVLLAIVAIYTVLGGMLSILVTDYLQFVIMGLGLIFIVVFVIFKFGWFPMLETISLERGDSGFSPVEAGKYGWDRILFDLLLAFAAVLTWQTMITRVLVAKDTATGRKIYQKTSPFFLVRFTLPAVLGIAALHYFGGDLFSGNPIAAMPNMLAAIVPAGLIGIVIASMLAAEMSTISSYMLAWSSVIYNDVVKPIRKVFRTDKREIYWNRVIIVLIAIFLLVYGLWYPLKDDLWVYLQITGTIYLSSMSVILIATCYWPAANNWGAFAAIVAGFLIPVSFLVLQQISSTEALTSHIGPYKVGIATYIAAALAMLGGSWCKNLFNKAVQP